MSRHLKILVADDSDAVLLHVSQILSELGHKPILARDGLEAVRLFISEAPDMVLMDVVMPNMDGCQATWKIKQLAGGNWIPVIFLSSRDSEEDMLQGLASGGDDYIAKPVRRGFLEAKIKAAQRVIGMHRLVGTAAEELAIYRAENEREQKLAKTLMERIIGADKFDHRRIERWNRAANRFSGDIFAAEYTPTNELNVIIADVTGHGLAAAVNVVPVVEVFYTMTRKGHSIANISREINRKVRQFLPTEYFVAAALATINCKEGIVEVWNGGMPSPFFVDEHGAILHEWKSVHLPLGILQDTDFETATEVFEWPSHGKLLLYTDGLPEAEGSDGARFGQERIKQALSGVPSERQFADLVEAANSFMDVDRISDDISLAAVKCCEKNSSIRKPEPISAPSQAKLAIKLSAPEFKSFDASSWLTTWFEQLQFARKQCQELFLVASELYTNALDHGILALDSSLKADNDGFAKYLDLRRERLDQLQHGIIEIEVERLEREGAPYIRIMVRNDASEFSKGFDREQAQFDPGTEAYGRGIFLVKSLCSDVEYSKEGNQVEAFYRLA